MASGIIPGKIQVKQAVFNEDTCVDETYLLSAQSVYPAKRDVIEYSNQRMLSTLIASDAGTDPRYGLGQLKTKIGAIPKDKMIGNTAYRYDVQGRIQVASEIIQQVGATAADGTFQLLMKTNHLYNGMNCLFNGQDFQARVMGEPQGSSGFYLYTFKSPDGRAFNWTTHVAGQAGTKTCFGGYTSYEGQSQKGYGRSSSTSSFIQHMTIQRKTTAITGGANATTLWVEFDGLDGTRNKGWYYRQQQQDRLEFMMENEFQKFFGLSSMKDGNGQLLPKSNLIVDGKEVIQGDGIIPQIMGNNELYGSGVNGDPTLSDYNTMMTMLTKKSNMVSGNTFYAISGTDGCSNFQSIMATYGFQIIRQTVTQTNEAGGANVAVGFNFQEYNFNGDKVILVKHPLFDDDTRFTEISTTDGRNLQSSMMVWLNANSVNGKSNIEVLSMGGNGANRSFVSAELNGMTGMPGSVISSVDSVEFNMLMQDLIAIYDTNSSGILRKS